MSNEHTKTKNLFENLATSNSYHAVDEVYRKSALGVKRFFDTSKLDKETNVVDLGAGTGISSEILSEDFQGNFCVVEPSKPMLEQAKKRLGENFLYVQATAEEMYQAFNRDVDLVFALNCIHLFPDLAKAFAGIAASLKRGGRVIFNITAPSYAFDDISKLEKEIYQANINFYRALNKISANPILESTVNLLEENLNNNKLNAFTQESLTQFLQALNFKFIEMQILEIEADINYQKNIWRMMANSFLEDQKRIEELIEKIELPQKMLVKQAVFIFENLN